MKKIFIGTSGWDYPHWGSIFYPENLASKDKLKYYSRQFKTVEVNYSFYHLPKPKIYQNWYSQTPEDFLFTVKASRFVTHIKRLKGVKGPWRTFIKNALNLKEKLGPILFQFPPNFKATGENIKKLKDFLKFIRVNPRRYPRKSAALRFAFEFRHQGWCEDRIYKILKKYNCAWVIADSPQYPCIETLRRFRSGRSAKGGNRPKVEKVTADFVYVRMHAHTPQRGQARQDGQNDEVSPRLVCGHGSKVLFSSKYTKKELKNLAEKIKKWLKQKKDVFVYFNNDAHGYAVENAKTLTKLLKS